MGIVFLESERELCMEKEGWWFIKEPYIQSPVKSWTAIRFLGELMVYVVEGVRFWIFPSLVTSKEV